MTKENNADFNAADLKQARESSGLTLNELHERTRISARYLEAIENGDFHVLPVPTYSKNFIRTYADAIGIDSGPVLQRYENYLKNLHAPAADEEAEQTCQVKPPARPKPYKALLWILLIIIIFASAAFFISNRDTRVQESVQKTTVQNQKEVFAPATKSEQPAAMPIEINLQKPENPVVSKPNDNQPQAVETISVKSWSDQATDQKQNKEPEKPAPSPEKKNAKKEALHHDEELSTVVIQATEETWIRIQADDKAAFQMMLKAGENVSHKAARFNVDIGNAGGVRISFNGKTIKNLGKPGQVIHLSLP